MIDRHPASTLPQPLEHPDPIQKGQHDVEDDQSRRERKRLLETSGPVKGATHVKAEVLELRFDEAGDRTVVFHQ